MAGMGRLPIALLAAAFALALTAPAGAAPVMLCQGPDGEYLISYDEPSGIVTFDGMPFVPIVPPDDMGGVAFLTIGTELVLISFADMLVDFSTADGMQSTRQDGCRPAPADAAQDTDGPDLAVADVQRMLGALGFDIGPADGVMDARTRGAISAFQIIIGVRPTGTLSADQAARLAELAAAVAAPAGEGRDAGETTAPSAADSRPTFQDCDVCPVMVEIPPGRFMMGASEADMAVPYTECCISYELPQHEVVIDYPFAIGKYEVTVAEFGAYVRETGAAVGGKCEIRLMEHGPDARRFTGTLLVEHPYSPFMVAISDGSYAQPGLPVTERQPAVCVSRNEILGYLGWLSARTGREYRLPSEAEWEYAARAGTQTVGFWGDDPAEACDYANFADRLSGYQASVAAPCAESIRPAWTAEVGSYRPNAWGLHDMLGNVQELVADCVHDYEDAPADGSAWTEPDCLVWGARGGDYELPAQSMRVAERLFWGSSDNEGGSFPVWDSPEEEAHGGRFNTAGFRVAVSLGGGR